MKLGYRDVMGSTAGVVPFQWEMQQRPLKKLLKRILEIYYEIVGASEGNLKVGIP